MSEGAGGETSDRVGSCQSAQHATAQHNTSHAEGHIDGVCEVSSLSHTHTRAGRQAGRSVGKYTPPHLPSLASMRQPGPHTSDKRTGGKEGGAGRGGRAHMEWLTQGR
mmetsp:Transcript_52961/g.133316  ORF Transcript_52961/g.133316 Transcript_52961/m.133316 type:complete len:108 (+) Transcript_52961:175-498(+)